MEEFNELKLINNWREILNLLSKGKRICPVCGLILNIRFKKHLFIHGITVELYVCLLNYLNELPLCKYCNKNKVKLSHYSMHDFCSHKCRAKYLVDNGILHLLRDNLIRDDNGKSIIAINANKSRLANGNHPFLHDNLELDDRGRSINHTKSNNTRLINGNHNFQVECILSSGTWHSSGELYIIEVIKSLGYNILTNKIITNTVSNNAPYYIPDGYIKLYNLCIECDGFNLKKNTDGTYKDYWKLKYLDYKDMGYNLLILRSDNLSIAKSEVDDHDLLINYIESYN